MTFKKKFLSYGNIVECKIGNHSIRLKTSEFVKPPSEFSQYFANYPAKLYGRVLDIGTGTGIQAISAVLKGAESVYITDINEYALEIALENAKLNRISRKIKGTAPGNMFNNLPLGVFFDTIICNAAATPTPLKNPKERFFYAGPLGRNMIDPLITESPKFLRPGGQLIITHSSLAGFDESLDKLKKHFKVSVVGQKTLPFRFELKDENDNLVYNQQYFDQIGGTRKKIYALDIHGKPWETLWIIRALKI